jgi:hypothetical protein
VTRWRGKRRGEIADRQVRFCRERVESPLELSATGARFAIGSALSETFLDRARDVDVWQLFGVVALEIPGGFFVAADAVEDDFGVREYLRCNVEWHIERRQNLLCALVILFGLAGKFEHRLSALGDLFDGTSGGGLGLGRIGVRFPVAPAALGVGNKVGHVGLLDTGLVGFLTFLAVDGGGDAGSTLRGDDFWEVGPRLSCSCRLALHRCGTF